MFIRGQLSGGAGSKAARMSGSIKIEQYADTAQFVMFETRPKDNPETNAYYEIV